MSDVIAESMWRTSGWVLRRAVERGAGIHAVHLCLEECVLVDDTESLEHDGGGPKQSHQMEAQRERWHNHGCVWDTQAF